MGVWSRLFKGKRGTLEGGENLLVISDVHLGEDIVIEGPARLGEYIRALNFQLADFVASHRANRVGNRSWRLVINGDMFDFSKVSLSPEPEEAFQQWSRSEVERRDERGIPNTAENVVWKMERIIEVHRPLFKELALFLLDGNALTFIEGNHDAEFFFEEVQQTLRENLVGLAEQLHRRERKPKGLDADALRERVTFREWFDADPGRFHIEHGHQYDEYCSFEYQLAPYDRGDAETLATPMSLRAAPYFPNLAADFTHMGLTTLTLRAIIRFAFSLGPRIVWQLFIGYWCMIFDLMGQVGPKRRAARQQLEARHQRRLRAMSEETPYGFSTLEQLDTVKATPAEYSRLKMYHASYLDRFLIGGAVVLGLIPALFLTWELAAIWCASVLVLGLIAIWVTGRAGKVDLPGRLRHAAARIAEITGVRYVIFGHSHRPELTNLRESYGVGKFGENSFYLNGGSWVTREILLGEKGEGMTYVEITDQGALLQRWRGSGKRPLLLAATDPDIAARGADVGGAGRGE